MASDKPANLPVKQQEAAKKLSISERALRHARRVQDHGAPELVRAVDRGQLAVSAAEKASRLAPELQRKIAAEAEAGNANAARTVIKQEQRAAREADLGKKQIAAPVGKFGLILEDYEWDHVTWSEAGKDRHAGNHYAVSRDAHTADEIVEKTKGRFACAADDSVVWMWATVPHLAIAIDVLRKRGYEYKSHYVWCKDSIITGYWSRSKHEVLLIGVKGNIPCPAMGTQDASLIFGPSGKHSEKPESAMRMIERYFPTLPRIELNARRRRPGWQVWGSDLVPAEQWRIDFERQALARGLITDDGMVRTTPTSVVAFEFVTADEWPRVLDGVEIAKLEAPPTPAVVHTERPASVSAPNCLDEEVEDIPAFLKRQTDNSVPSVPVASPRATQSVSGEATG